MIMTVIPVIPPDIRPMVQLDGCLLYTSLHTSDNIIGLHGQDLLQGVGCAIRLQSPNLHLTETLSAELCLTTQRLLGNKGVWAGGTCMDLIVNQVRCV